MILKNTYNLKSVFGMKIKDVWQILKNTIENLGKLKSDF